MENPQEADEVGVGVGVTVATDEGDGDGDGTTDDDGVGAAIGGVVEDGLGDELGLAVTGNAQTKPPFGTSAQVRTVHPIARAFGVQSLVATWTDRRQIFGQRVGSWMGAGGGA